jgi:D-serine deaminase-like pyridoxal phosphate-dependent protein
MAAYFAPEWNDITVAFPVNLLEIDTINHLLFTYPTLQLNVLVENTEAVEALESNLILLHTTLGGSRPRAVGIYIKIDCGYGRTGIPAEDISRIDPILQLLPLQDEACTTTTKLQFLGFLTHAGNTYQCRSPSEIYDIHKTSQRLMSQLKEHYLAAFPDLQLSMGDTPSCSVVAPNDLELFDEMRPGNFVFYDLEQAAIGACAANDISVAMAVPIVAKHTDRRELVVYGGGVHCSKERLVVVNDNDNDGTTTTIYGRVVVPQHHSSSSSSFSWGDIIDGMYVRSLSQEHGIVVVPRTEDLDKYHIGDILLFLPVHSCMTADCLKHKGYLTTNGEHIERMTN